MNSTTFTISSSSDTTGWFVIGTDGNLSVYNDPIQHAKDQFAKLKEKFFDGREFHTNMEIIERWQRDERLAALVQKGS
jgi:hypothetical protein